MPALTDKEAEESFNAAASRLIDKIMEIEENAAAARKLHKASLEKVDDACEKMLAVLQQADEDEITAVRRGATRTARAIRPMKTVRFKINP